MMQATWSNRSLITTSSRYGAYRRLGEGFAWETGVVGSTLAHVMVVAGTTRQWDLVGEDEWRDTAEVLGAAVAAAGGAWLTLRAYEQSAGDAPGPTVDRPRRQMVVADGRCTVVIDPMSDGRERFAEAMRRLPRAVKVDEKSVAGALYEPADVEPDLVLILGPSTRLPPSLVWELAYGELVFLPVGFTELAAEHVAKAVEDFHTRRRRFGGLDADDDE
jgi:Putative undecaprenyl diphosphate synthase